MEVTTIFSQNPSPTYSLKWGFSFVYSDKDEKFYQENKTFTFKTLYGEEKYEVFSTHIYENDPYIIKTRFNNDEFDKFISKLKEISDHDVNIEVNSSDKILSLITCTYEFKDARYVVHAKRID